MFKMELFLVGFLEPETSFNQGYDKEIDDFRSVLADICEMIQCTNRVKFYVAGFGENEWSVDCKVDLLGVIEQIPEIIRRILDDSFEFTLDFYEQGIERELIFEEKKGIVYILCNSRTHWKPNPKRIQLDKVEVKNIFFGLYRDFINISTILCKNLMIHPLMKEFIIELPN